MITQCNEAIIIPLKIAVKSTENCITFIAKYKFNNYVLVHQIILWKLIACHFHNNIIEKI